MLVPSGTLGGGVREGDELGKGEAGGRPVLGVCESIDAVERREPLMPMGMRCVCEERCNNLTWLRI